MGTSVHASEMTDTLGPILAESLSVRVTGGRYLFKLLPTEIMAIRGALLQRIQSEIVPALLQESIACS